MKKPACCFTGHKPQKFYLGSDEEHEGCIQLRAVLEREIGLLLRQGIVTYYCGMALGTDLWCAEILQSLRQGFPQIKLIAVIPFEGQANRWSAEYRERYFHILAHAQEEILLHRHYTKRCMMERNRYMVDHCTHLIGVYNGSPGGTQNTLEYARKQRLCLTVIHPRTLEVARPPSAGLKLLKPT